jgi:hypothetical protein
MRRLPDQPYSWRIELRGAGNGSAAVVLQRTIMIPPHEHPPTADDLAELRAEAADEQGIRRRFVDCIRQLIASGHYESSERWAVAEEMLARRLEDAR